MEYKGNHLTSLVILRVLIGWHLLYEGIVKLLNPYWSATEYLRESQWILTVFFRWMIEDAVTSASEKYYTRQGLVYTYNGIKK